MRQVMGCRPGGYTRHLAVAPRTPDTLRTPVDDIRRQLFLKAACREVSTASLDEELRCVRQELTASRLQTSCRGLYIEVWDLSIRCALSEESSLLSREIVGLLSAAIELRTTSVTHSEDENLTLVAALSTPCGTTGAPLAGVEGIPSLDLRSLLLVCVAFVDGQIPLKLSLSLGASEELTEAWHLATWVTMGNFVALQRWCAERESTSAGDDLLYRSVHLGLRTISSSVTTRMSVAFKPQVTEGMPIPQGLHYVFGM